MIKTRAEACRILGIRLSASEADIKAAYKALVKIYHPDVSKNGDISRYNEIVEAYEFLCPKSGVTPLAPTSKVMGTTSRSNVYSGYRSSANDYAKFDKQMKKQKQQKNAAFQEMAKEYSKEYAQREAKYENAMKAIDAVLAAKAIESMILSNSMKDK